MKTLILKAIHMKLFISTLPVAAFFISLSFVEISTKHLTSCTNDSPFGVKSERNDTFKPIPKLVKSPMGSVKKTPLISRPYRAADNVGFGWWGDTVTCGNISEYNPVTDKMIGSNYFGYSVSISGNFAIIGSLYDDPDANHTRKGSASIFKFNGKNWVFFQKLTDPGGSENDHFGCSVSLSGKFALIGSDADDIGSNKTQGSASIFELAGDTWVFRQKINDPEGRAEDYFGQSVSISGNYAVIGAPYSDIADHENQGSAIIYALSGESWHLKQKITDAEGITNEFFGKSVSIDNNYLIIAAPGDSVLTEATWVTPPVFYKSGGSANIWQLSGSSWNFMQKISSGNNFANSVSVSGNRALIGADGQYVNGNEGQTGHEAQGAAFFYHYNGNSWVVTQRVFNPGGIQNDNFGSSVSLSGNYAMIGADRCFLNTGFDKGVVVIYNLINTEWKPLQIFTDPYGKVADRFGAGLAIDGSTKRFLSGACGSASGNGKAIFGKIR